MCVWVFPGSFPNEMEFSWIQSVLAIHGDFSQVGISLGPTSASCKKFRCFSRVQPRNVEPRGHPFGTKEGLRPWPIWLGFFVVFLCLKDTKPYWIMVWYAWCPCTSRIIKAGDPPVNGWHFTLTSFMLFLPAAKLHLPLANSALSIAMKLQNATSTSTCANIFQVSSSHPAYQQLGAQHPPSPYAWGRHSTSKDNTTKAEASGSTAHHGSFWYTQRFRQFRLLFRSCLGCNRMAHLNDALDTWWI